MRKVSSGFLKIALILGSLVMIAGTVGALVLVCPKWGGCFSGHPCQSATMGDGKIFWAGLQHNSFDLSDRSPFGSVKTDQDSVRIRFRTCAHDLSRVRLVVWSTRDGQSKKITMNPSPALDQPKDRRYWTWEARIPIPKIPDLLGYYFEMRDKDALAFYLDDDIRRSAGGLGQVVEEWVEPNFFQLTVYDKGLKVPEWTKGAIVYQIFPDRFRNADPSNDPEDGSGFVYQQKIVRKGWRDPVCTSDAKECHENQYNSFYGGDLQGITEKLSDLSQLGASVLYLTPFLESPSNHRYDISNFKKVDSKLGELKDFQKLVDEAKKRGIRIIADGVFNHVSADSPYFDLYGRWNAKQQLVSPEGIGVNDGSGACESSKSQWRSWFFIPDVGRPAEAWAWRDKPLCPNPLLKGSNEAGLTYDSWFGFFNHPRLNTEKKEVRDFFFQKGVESVAPYWSSLGLSGWRLDAVNQIDMGELRDRSKGFWRAFKKAVREVNSETWLVGEWWGNAAPWFLGQEWDSVTNYWLRSALLDWMFDACQGQGCGGDHFTDNDSNSSSPLGVISRLKETEFLHYLRGIQEAYPEPVFQSTLNLIGSHDTNRILFLLKKISKNEDESLARDKLKFLMAFLMTYPGAPTIYYGDEVGVQSPGFWRNNTWEDEPYNRSPYPWEDQGLQPDQDLRQYLRALGQLRLREKALREGDFKVVYANDDQRVVVFSRELSGQEILVALNRKDNPQNIRFQLEGSSDGELVEVFPRVGKIQAIQSGWVTLSSVERLGVRILKRQPQKP